MKRKGLIKRIRKLLGTGLTDRENDLALKFDFCPFTAAIFGEDEFTDFMENDLLTVKDSKFEWVIQQIAERLARIVTEIDPDHTEEIYLTIYVYGLITRFPKTDSFIFDVALDTNNEYVTTISVPRDVTKNYTKPNSRRQQG